MARQGRVLERVDLQGGRRNNAYIYRNPQKGGKWHLHFLNRETNQKHRFLLKRPNGGYPHPSAAGEEEALGLAQERYIELRTRTDRGEVVNVLTIGEMVDQFLEREKKRISNRPHEGITEARYRLIRNQCKHFLDYCSDGRGGSKKQVHLVRRGFLDGYQHWREEKTNAYDDQGRRLPRPTTLNGEFSTIKRMWEEVALQKGFITRDQLPQMPYAKSPKDKTFRRSAFTSEEWMQLEKAARLYWIKGKSRFDEQGNPLGYYKITRGVKAGEDSYKAITRNSIHGAEASNKSEISKRAKNQLVHREMLYLAMRISMESGIRIGTLRQMRWSHISENKTLGPQERKTWCIVEIPSENTKTGRWHEVSATIAAFLERLKRISKPKGKSDLLFRNQSTQKPFSDRIWRDGLLEMLVETGLAEWSEDDSNNQRKAKVKSGKTLTWYSFRHTYITMALERGVPIATVCNNCDTSIEYIQEHYFHYDAKRATQALATGRKALKAATDQQWIEDLKQGID